MVQSFSHCRSTSAVTFPAGNFAFSLATSSLTTSGGLTRPCGKSSGRFGSFPCRDGAFGSMIWPGIVILLLLHRIVRGGINLCQAEPVEFPKLTTAEDCASLLMEA